MKEAPSQAVFPYLCLKGELNGQYWQMYLSSRLLRAAAIAEWLLSCERRPCMDMNTRSHWPHACFSTRRSLTATSSHDPRSGSGIPGLASVATATAASGETGPNPRVTGSASSKPPFGSPSPGTDTGISGTSC